MANDLLGLYLSLKQNRQREQQFAQQQEARAQNERQQALLQSIDVAFKTGDANLAAGLYDATTPFGQAGDYNVLNAMAKAGKAKQKENESLAQYQQTGPQLQQGIEQTFAPLEAARLAGRAPTAQEQEAFGRAHLAAAQGLGQDSPYLRGVLQGGVAGGIGKAAAEQGKVKYDTWFNRESGRFVNVRTDDQDKMRKLDADGYFPVNSVNMGGTPKDFSTQITPTAATGIQKQLVGLMESGARLGELESKYDPKYFERMTQLKVRGLQELEKWGAISEENSQLLSDYNEYMRTVGEETLAYTVSLAASTFTDRLREHIESIRLSPELAPSVALKRIQNLRLINRQSTARLNFALRNGIVSATDFDPSGNLTSEAKDRLEQAIPANIPGFSSPSSNKRIDRVMENRYDALEKEAALNRIPPAERDAWVDARMQEEFFTEPQVGQVLHDEFEFDVMNDPTLQMTPEERAPQLDIQRIR